MSAERRRHLRQSRLLRFLFDWSGAPQVAVTTDISLGGGFLNTVVMPPVGSLLTLTWDPPAPFGHPVVLQAIVERVVDPRDRISVVPGLGVRWLEWSSSSAPADLSALLSQTFGEPLLAEPGADLDSRWHPPVPTAATGREPAALHRELALLRPAASSDPSVSPEERRGRPRRPSGAAVTYYVRAAAGGATVRDVSLRGLWLDTEGPPPELGEVVTCRYPLPRPDGLEWVRLVGVVVRHGQSNRPGFAIELLRIDPPAALAAHLKTPEVRPPPIPRRAQGSAKIIPLRPHDPDRGRSRR